MQLTVIILPDSWLQRKKRDRKLSIGKKDWFLRGCLRWAASTHLSLRFPK